MSTIQDLVTFWYCWGINNTINKVNLWVKIQMSNIRSKHKYTYPGSLLQGENSYVFPIRSWDLCWIRNKNQIRKCKFTNQVDTPHFKELCYTISCYLIRIMSSTMINCKHSDWLRKKERSFFTVQISLHYFIIVLTFKSNEVGALLV